MLHNRRIRSLLLAQRRDDHPAGLPESSGACADAAGRRGPRSLLRISALPSFASLWLLPTVEPAGGSPTGAPTGPVILVGEVAI
jgi:hypothetical protein